MKTGKFTLFVNCNFLVALGTTIMQSKHKQTNCKHSRRKSYGSQLSIKELFKKTISNSSLNSHVHWDTLYNSHRQFLSKSKLNGKTLSHGNQRLFPVILIFFFFFRNFREKQRRENFLDLILKRRIARRIVR